MDLKFTFNGPSGDDEHDHGTPSSGVKPLNLTPTNSSTALELHARLANSSSLIAEVRSVDGVVYSSSTVEVIDQDPATLAGALRSAAARAGAGLEAHLLDSISVMVIDLGGGEETALGALGIATVEFADAGAAIAVVTDELQRRTGIASGTPIRIA